MSAPQKPRSLVGITKADLRNMDTVARRRNNANTGPQRKVATPGGAGGSAITVTGGTSGTPCPDLTFSDCTEFMNVVGRAGAIAFGGGSIDLPAGAWFLATNLDSSRSNPPADNGRIAPLISGTGITLPNQGLVGYSPGTGGDATALSTVSYAFYLASPGSITIDCTTQATDAATLGLILSIHEI